MCHGAAIVTCDDCHLPNNQHGDGVIEPLKPWLGLSLGTLAVYVFFAISGFLIAASYQRSQSVTRFLLARGLRLFPGLAVSLVLVAMAPATLLALLLNVPIPALTPANRPKRSLSLLHDINAP